MTKHGMYVDVYTGAEIAGYAKNLVSAIETGHFARARELLADINHVTSDWLSKREPGYEEEQARAAQEELNKRAQQIILSIWLQEDTSEVPGTWVKGEVSVAGITRVHAFAEVMLPPPHATLGGGASMIAREVHDNLGFEYFDPDDTYYERGACEVNWLYTGGILPAYVCNLTAVRHGIGKE